MTLYTGKCGCGSEDFVNNMGEYECTQCGEMFSMNPADADEPVDVDPDNPWEEEYEEDDNTEQIAQYG